MDGEILNLYEFKFDDVFPAIDPSKLEETEFILTLAMIHNDLTQLWLLLKSLTFDDESEAENAYAHAASIYYARVALFHLHGAYDYIESRMDLFRNLNPRRFALYIRLRKRSTSLKILIAKSATDLRDRLAHYAIIDRRSPPESIQRTQPLFEATLQKYVGKQAEVLEQGRWIRFAFVDDFLLTMDKMDLDPGLKYSEDDQVERFVKLSLDNLRIFERICGHVVWDYLAPKLDDKHPLVHMNPVNEVASPPVPVSIPLALVQSVKRATGRDSTEDAVRAAIEAFLSHA